MTNLPLGVLAGRTLGPEGLGTFAVIFTTYLLALGIARGLTSEPLMVRYSTSDHRDWRHGVEQATGTTVIVACLMGLIVFAIGLSAAGSLRYGLLALGVAMPGLLVQDAWRYAFFASGRGSAAFVNDLIWAALMVPMLVVVASTEQLSVGLLVLTWGSAASVAALVGHRQTGVRPQPQRALCWLREQRDLGPRYVAEFAAVNGIGQLTFYGIGAVTGLAELGALRAGLLLFGPVNVLGQGMTIVMIRAQAWRVRYRSEHLMATSVLLSAVQIGIAVIWGTLLVLLPASVGQTLLGSSWESARHLLLPIALGTAGYLSMSGPGVILRALAAARRSLRAGLVLSLLTLIGGIGGATLGSARAAAVGLTVAFWLGAIGWWWQLTHALQDERIQGPRDGERI